MNQAHDGSTRLHALLEAMNTSSWRREDAHALLDAALDLAEAESDAEGEAGGLAQAAALALSRAVAGWMVPRERTPEEWDALAASDPAQWREDVAGRMRLTPALLPQPAVDQLMFALWALNGVTQPKILEPKPASEAHRFSKHALERAMLAWIEIEKARGRPAGVAQKAVADAVGRSPSAINSWLKEWRKEKGLDHVEAVMLASRAYARGEETLPPVPDELLLVRFLASEKASILYSLANSWKA